MQATKLTYWQQLRVIAIHSLIGIALFYLVVHPITMVIYWFEFNKREFDFGLFRDALFSRIRFSFSIEMLEMSTVFIALGAIIGIGSGAYYNNIRRRNRIIQLQEGEMNRSVASIIEQGETDRIEFKSSLRYDYHQDTINLSLEYNIVKTIVGFLNSSGGKLIIGVSDDGEILGLSKDYQSLKKKNKDGFELKLFELVNNYIGPEFCAQIHVFFHKLNQTEICVIEIIESKVPAYVNQKQKTEFYLRMGNSTRSLSVKEAVSYINLNKKI